MNSEVLRERMRAEAIGSSPAFDPVLHERIMRRVDPHGQRAVRDTPGKRHRRALWAWAGSVAAAVTLAAGVWRATTPTPEAPAVVRVPVPAVEPVVAKAAEIRQRVNERALEYRVAYLDHDARQLKDFLVRQVDLLPNRQ